jgi:cytochrome P450
MGTDTFMAVSPMGNILFTNEPEASSQLLAGRVFEKPAMKIMPMLNIYGPTITGTDGAEARLYRKIAAPFFTTQRMKQVWSESILCVEKWMRHLELNKDTDPDLRPTLGFFNLHVISKVGFGSDMGNFDPPSEARAPDDRALSFSQAMLSFINHFMTVFLTPKFILSKKSQFLDDETSLT